MTNYYNNQSKQQDWHRFTKHEKHKSKTKEIDRKNKGQNQKKSNSKARRFPKNKFKNHTCKQPVG